MTKFSSFRFYHETAIKKFQSVASVTKENIYNYLAEILRGDQFIHENILCVPWNSVDL